MPPVRRARLRIGCLGSTGLVVVVAVAVTLLLAPWSFHVGDRWTPNGIWRGAGRLRESTGAQYGLFLSFYADLHHRGSRSFGGPALRNGLRGNAQVCTAAGAKYRFDVRGGIAGAWLHTEGGQMTLDLREPPGPKLRRTFSLYGAWSGGELPLDDHKSMFRNFRPDGTLTPSGSYTSPVPERHATVTLASGNQSDFDSLCASLHAPLVR